MVELKTGLLPMYVKLYDDSWPEMRERVEDFYRRICREFENRGVQVETVPVCRTKDEFSSAVELFEQQGVDAVVTLHLAYSPSLESADILAFTKLPVVVLDTTPAYYFGSGQKDSEIFFNHGIHGVQDMCNLLARKGKRFFIEAGHWKESDVIDRVTGRIKGIRAASEMQRARVGRIGKSFAGMGDFQVAVEELKRDIGIELVEYDFAGSSELLRRISPDEIEKEMQNDGLQYNLGQLDDEIYRKSTAVGLALRNWINENRLTAFTINFMDITRESGVDCMPFLEISKAMARGTGYAGEGDVLTAALCGALMSVYPQTSFVEMFCPDWKNGSVFLSHMGEMNLNLAARKPRVVKKEFPFTNADDTTAGYARFKEGEALHVNLAPAGKGIYRLIIAEGEMPGTDTHDSMQETIRGWFKPRLALDEFLQAYSELGGTHHSVLVYGCNVKDIAAMGRVIGWEVVVID